MADYKNPFATKKSPKVAEMTKKIVKDIQVREKTQPSRTEVEQKIHDKNIGKVEKAKKKIEKAGARTTNISIRILEERLMRLDKMVFTKGMEGLNQNRKPLKRNAYIEEAIEEKLKKEGF
jgi:predicted DNA binding CopG/RHH family protein